LSDGVDLVTGTTTTNSHFDIHVFELVSSNQQYGLIHLQSHLFGVHQIEGFSVHSNGAVAVLAGGDSSCVLLSSKCLDLNIFINNFIINK
jgi:hypothetical protein